jgi:hypothetical protein
MKSIPSELSIVVTASVNSGWLASRPLRKNPIASVSALPSRFDRVEATFAGGAPTTVPARLRSGA